MQYAIDFENRVVAVHDDSRNLAGLYPGLRIVRSATHCDFGETVPGAEPVPRRYSKLKIYDELQVLGLYDALKAWLEAAGEFDRWLLAQEVAEDDPGFTALREQFREAVPDFDELLSRCEV